MNSPILFVDLFGLDAAEIFYPTKSGKSKIRIETNDEACVRVDGEFMFSVTETGEYDFDYNWLRSDGNGGIVSVTFSDFSLISFYTPKILTYEVSHRNLTLHIAENQGLSVQTVSAQSKCIVYETRGGITWNSRSAKWIEDVTVKVSGIHKLEADRGLGKIMDVESPFGVGIQEKHWYFENRKETMRAGSGGRTPSRVPEAPPWQFSDTVFHTANNGSWFVLNHRKNEAKLRVAVFNTVGGQPDLLNCWAPIQLDFLGLPKEGE